MIPAARLLLLICLPVLASAQYYPARIFSLEEENINPSINTVYRTKKDYFLLGTTHGLYRFDGSRFNRIPFQNADYTDTVTALFEDSRGKTWVGFRNGRIAHLVNGILTYWNPDEGTPSSRVTSFCETQDGTLWFAAAGEGVYYLRNNRIFLVDTENGLFDLNISTLSARENEVLAGSDNGIYIINLQKEKAVVSNISPSDGLPDYIVTAIAPSPVGTWLGFHDNGFCLLPGKGNQVVLPAGKNKWNGGEITAIKYHQEDLWIATRSRGLWRYDFKDSSLFQVDLSIPVTQANLLETDLQGNLWSGGPGSILVRTPGKAVTLFPMPPGTMGEHIHALLQDASGKFWTTDQYNNLLRLDHRNGNPVKKKAVIKELNEKTDITSLYQDPLGKIWIGTMGRGLFVLDTNTLQYQHILSEPLLHNSSVLSITGRGENIYISTLQGCFSLNSSARSPRITKIDLSGLSHGYVYTMMEDSKGRLWIATDGNGISVLENGTLTTFDSRAGLRDDRVYDLTEDHKGNIWFSTASAGIYRYDHSTFKNYGLKEGLSNLNISAIKCDAAGNIVIINKRGLDILDPVTGNIFYYNENYGLQTLNVEDLGANGESADGNIYFISGNNIAGYHPASPVTAPKTILDNVLLFLKPLGDTSQNRFSHDQNNFTFQFTGIYFSDPDQVFYQYKLEGLDTNWITTRDRSKAFPSLPPGKYTFRVRSSLNRNFENASEASYSFTIREAFYKTPWFISIALLLITGAIYLVFKSREKRLRRIEAMKNEQERVRFALLRNQVNPHFLFNSFNTLITTIEEDPVLAVEYTGQLSDFFRNIVTYRDKDVISVEEELNLLKTYLYLQKKRYGENLQLILPGSIPSEFYIPPLTLQLLMENAIKHNAVSRQTPLVVEVMFKDEYLEVRNNKNTRMSKEKGAGMGLQNIINRYGMLTNRKVIIREDSSYFSVSLPRLKNKE